MEPNSLAPAAVAIAFALIHILGSRLKFLHVTPRSIWLSIAGGVSVAYVFVHLLPELAEYQEAVGEALGEGGGILNRIESHSYLVALVGLAAFYGLDRMARRSACPEGEGGAERRPTRGVFWVHLLSFAVYNALIGYLLVHREETGLGGLAMYAFAMGVHFLVNDQGLREHHGHAYDREGRWLLALSPIAGWGLGIATTVSPLIVSALFAFLAGGVILNVLKEELPEDRDSRFWAFALGTGAYAALLLMIG